MAECHYSFHTGASRHDLPRLDHPSCLSGGPVPHSSASTERRGRTRQRSEVRALERKRCLRCHHMLHSSTTNSIVTSSQPPLLVSYSSSVDNTFSTQASNPQHHTVYIFNVSLSESLLHILWNFRHLRRLNKPSKWAVRWLPNTRTLTLPCYCCASPHGQQSCCLVTPTPQPRHGFVREPFRNWTKWTLRKSPAYSSYRRAPLNSTAARCMCYVL